MRKLLILSTILFVAFHASSQPKKWILEENFNDNSLGWVEEFTEDHVTEIKDGYLYIYSLDTSKYQTSNSPNFVRFLLGLPKQYTITSSFEFISRDLPATAGVIIYSASLNYRFSISDSLVARIEEYSYSKEEEVLLQSKEMTGIPIDRPIEFRIRITDRNAEFFVNDMRVGEVTLRARSWEDIRLFTTTGSAIKIDYLRIR